MAANRGNHCGQQQHVVGETREMGRQKMDVGLAPWAFGQLHKLPPI